MKQQACTVMKVVLAVAIVVMVAACHSILPNDDSNCPTPLCRDRDN